MIENFYIAECYSFGCNAEFYINDIPIAIRGFNFSPFWSGPINQYLINEKNTIHVIIKPTNIPPKEGMEPEKVMDKPKRDEKIIMKISSCPKGALTAGPECREIVIIEWPQKTNYSELHVFPHGIKAETTIHDLKPETKTWETASTLKLNDKTILQAGQFLEEIHEIIEAGKSDKFIEYSKHRIMDNAHAYDKTIRENVTLIKNGFKQNLARENWGLLPLDTKSYNFRLCRNNKLIHCIAKDLKPIIREIPDEKNNSAYYDMFIGKIENKWTILL